MSKLVALAVLVVAAMAAPLSSDLDLDVHWAEFKAAYNKTYSVQDEMDRRMIFEKNMNFIRGHNMAADLDQKTFRVGINEYADLTSREFADKLTGLIQANSTQGTAFIAADNIDMPDSVDWRTKGYVTPVKNQKQCGSCWAFSATGSLEGQHFKKSGKLVSLSEQNLVDCCHSEGHHGCGGGLMDLAFNYIVKSNGIDTEESYPYEATEGPCRFKMADVGATCTGYTDIPRGDEDALEKAVATIGPISVAIDAAHQSFQLYKSGTYYEPDCSSTRLDHGVLVVGYGAADGNDHWLVKNSWGATWGNKGYIHMSRNRDNNCGIATQASYPLVIETLVAEATVTSDKATVTSADATVTSADANVMPTVIRC